MKDITADVVNTLTVVNELMRNGDYLAANKLMGKVIKNLSPIEIIQESEYIIFKRSDIKNLVKAVEWINNDLEEIEP